MQKIQKKPRHAASHRPAADERARRSATVAILATLALSAACSSGTDSGTGTETEPTAGGSANGGARESSSGGAGNVGSSAGSGGTTGTSGAGGMEIIGSSGATGADGGFAVCDGLVVAGEQAVETTPLDIYLVFDRTASMGQDCAFTPGTSPPVASKACFATYAIAQYFLSVDPAAKTRLAFQFMSLAKNDCDGTRYSTPLIDMTPLPVTANHPLIQAISNENFAGGFGTHIEGALRGLSSYTAAHDRDVGQAAGRTTIGVLMTDGDPNGCNENIDALAKIVSDHLTATAGAVKMFFIGETGATLSSLEKYAQGGGATSHADFCGDGPSPCHYWDVGDGQPAAFASAISSIVGQATVSHPIPCTFEVPLNPDGKVLDPSRVNVRFTEKDGTPVDMYRVDSKAGCDAVGGWYYDDPTVPKEILLCESSCSAVTLADHAQVTLEFGCESRTPPIR
jgi:hypothetical protein